MKKQSKYFEMPTQTISRKVGSSFIDGLLLIIVGVILTLTAGFGALKQNKNFKQNNDQCFNSIRAMYQIQDDAKLQIVKGEDGLTVLATADYFEAYILPQIYRSYLEYEEDFKAKEIVLDDQKENASTLENDVLAFYFVHYKNEKQIQLETYNGKEPLTYFKNDIFFAQLKKDYFMDKENDLPTLKSSVAISLYQHIKKIEKNNDLFYEFSDAILAIRNLGLKDLANYDVYQNLYHQYETAYQTMAKYENVMLFITYTIAFLICVGIPMLVSKNGISVGKFLTRTRYVSDNGETFYLWKRALVTFFSWLCFMGVTILISLFSLGFQNMAIPLGNGLSISFLQFLLIMIAFMLVNTFIMLLTNVHRSLIDYITNVKQVDVTCYVEPKKDEIQ